VLYVISSSFGICTKAAAILQQSLPACGTSVAVTLLPISKTHDTCGHIPCLCRTQLDTPLLRYDHGRSSRWNANGMPNRKRPGTFKADIAIHRP
jgi:hypothetical protein